MLLAGKSHVMGLCLVLRGKTCVKFHFVWQKMTTSNTVVGYLWWFLLCVGSCFFLVCTPFLVLPIRVLMFQVFSCTGESLSQMVESKQWQRENSSACHDIKGKVVISPNTWLKQIVLYVFLKNLMIWFDYFSSYFTKLCTIGKVWK